MNSQKQSDSDAHEGGGFLVESEKREGAEPGGQVGRFDAIAVARASQAISGEIELEKLMETLMRIVIEHAGAQKALLLLARGDELTAEVLAVLENEEVRASRPTASCAELAPQAVLDFVRRSRERVILEDARLGNMFSRDPYLATHLPVSLLCLPMLRQSHLAGLLYLENNQVPGAFTAERVAVLELLAGQAAISLDNARLYTEMQRENRERKAAEERFRELLESAPEAMVIVGDRGEIRLVNSQTEKLFGYRRDELYGEKVELLVAPSYRDRHLEHRTEYMRNPQLRPMGAGLDLFAQRKDGSEFPVDISLSPLTTEEGTLVIAAVRDITERTRAEAELRESEQRYRQLNETLEQRIEEAVDELRQKNEMLVIQSRQAVMGEMISNIAHQWRQPLNTLGLLAQDLQMTYRAGGFSQEFIDANVRRTLEIIRHMSKTIDDFRMFFQPGKEKEPFRARGVLEKTLSLLEASLTAHNIKTEVEVTGDPEIIGYPNEFSHVLLNIVNNARDAFAAGQVPYPVINIRLYSEGGRTVVTVSDNAGGIPEQIIGKIFEPYFTTKGPEQGTGIGLFMCKTVIEKNMNGSIGVRNVGAGAEFRIEL